MRVLCSREHPAAFAGIFRLTPLATFRGDLPTRGAPIEPLDAAHYPPTAAFLIKQLYEIVRLRNTQVQIGGSGACVPYGLCASLRGPTQAGWRQPHTDMDRVCWP